MSEHDDSKLRIAMGKSDTTAALEQLQAQLESGEIACAALRLFHADGTWEDIALGGDELDKVEALANLRAAYARSN